MASEPGAAATKIVSALQHSDQADVDVNALLYFAIATLVAAILLYAYLETH